ncbi:MAG TPA: DUF3883 domain-containing protein [Brevundimonas sp.]|uniref:DUF3883 domain-containing protein n=1 Tax=Brevundimonas sp. TaxID=1871086 RepID=UPI002DE94C2C|nr:DUF3883 domain-containing protein [Brevundimonas sp.]
MADQGKIGTDWTDEELDLIVADHFAMLAAEQAGQPYVKAHHARALMERIGRTHRSVEFKHMNVSAVLTELGLPIIRGYRPMPNIQAAIFPAVDRYLSTHPDAWHIGEHALILPRERGRGTAAGGGGGDHAPGFAEPAGTFSFDEHPDAEPSVLPITAPPPLGPAHSRPEGLQRLVRKFDPATRDARNRVLGRLGEQHVLNHEIARLIAADRMDLAKKVEWTADVHGDGAGYDVRSFEPDGSDRLIEVKATRGGPTTDFFVTRTEREVSQERPDAWRLYRLHDLSAAPGLFILPPPLEASVRLTAEAWKATF